MHVEKDFKGTRGHTLKVESPFHPPQVSWFPSPELTTAHSFLTSPHKTYSRAAEQPSGPHPGEMSRSPCVQSNMSW